MTDKEKVIKGLQCCSVKGMCTCELQGCPYYPDKYNPYNECTNQLTAGALALLKEQNNPIKPTLNENHRYVSDAFKCGKCGHIIRFHAKYCEDCGQAVKWE